MIYRKSIYVNGIRRKFIVYLNLPATPYMYLRLVAKTMDVFVSYTLIKITHDVVAGFG